MKKHSASPVSFGLWIYILSDCVLFATLFAAYAVLHAETATGPSGAVLFSLPFVLLETLVLLTSSFACGMAIVATERKSLAGIWAGLVSTLLLGFGFVALELHEFRGLIAEGHGWQQSAFLSSFFALVGTHGLHVFVGALWLVTLLGYLSVRGLTDRLAGRIRLFALFWHFLDIIWICIFSFVYLLGSLTL